MFNIYDELKSPDEAGLSRYMMSRDRKLRGCVSDLYMMKEIAT